MDEKISEVRALQAELDNQNEIEEQAVNLIMKGRYQDATELLTLKCDPPTAVTVRGSGDKK